MKNIEKAIIVLIVLVLLVLVKVVSLTAELAEVTAKLETKSTQFAFDFKITQAPTASNMDTCTISAVPIKAKKVSKSNTYYAELAIKDTTQIVEPLNTTELAVAIKEFKDSSIISPDLKPLRLHISANEVINIDTTELLIEETYFKKYNGYWYAYNADKAEWVDPGIGINVFGFKRKVGILAQRNITAFFANTEQDIATYEKYAR